MEIKQSLCYDCPYKAKECMPENCECVKYKAWRKASNVEERNKKLKDLNIDLDESLLAIIFQLQEKIIIKIHSVSNLNQKEMFYWIDKYLVGIEETVRQTRKYLDYYHPIVIENNPEFIKKVIDILCFIVNLFIAGNSNAELIKKHYLNIKSSNVKDVYDLFDFALELQKDNYDCKINKSDLENELSNIFEKNEIIKEIREKSSKLNNGLIMLIMINNLLDVCGEIRELINWQCWEIKYNDIDMNELNDKFAEMFYCLIDIFASINCKTKNIKEIYLLRNIENIFKQEMEY